jgi:hypothetical protein
VGTAKLITLLDDKANGREAPAIPELKRNRNFFSIRNNSAQAWDLVMPALKPGSDGKVRTYKGDLETGELDVYQLDEDHVNKVIWMGRLSPKWGQLKLKAGQQYVLFPRFNGLMGSKIGSDDFARTLYLIDGNGDRLTCLLSRSKEDLAPTRLTLLTPLVVGQPGPKAAPSGPGQLAAPLRVPEVPLLMDKNFDDVAVIMVDQLLAPKARLGKPNA